MAHFGRSLKALLAERDWSQRDFAEHSGIHVNTVNRIVNQAAPRMNGSTYKLIAQAFELSTDELDRLWREQRVPQQIGDSSGGIPLLSNVPAGNGDNDPAFEGLDNGLGVTYIPRELVGIDDPTAFALTVKGDSMMPDYADGDVVICSPQAKHEDGMVAAVRLANGECTLKQVNAIDESRIELRPMNSRHTRRVVEREEVMRMARVVGRYQKLWKP